MNISLVFHGRLSMGGPETQLFDVCPGVKSPVPRLAVFPASSASILQPSSFPCLYHYHHLLPPRMSLPPWNTHISGDMEWIYCHVQKVTRELLRLGAKVGVPSSVAVLSAVPEVKGK